MLNPSLPPPRSAESQIRRQQAILRVGMWLNVAMIGAASAYGAYVAYLALSTQAWQFFVIAGAMGALVLAAVIGAFLSWRGRPDTGALIMFGVMVLALLTNSVLLVGLGLAFLVMAIALTVAVITPVLPQRTARRVTVIGVVVGVVALLTDIFVPTANRIVQPTLQILAPVIGGALAVAAAIVALRQFRDYTVRTKLIIAFVGVAIFGAGTVSLIADQVLRAQLTESAGTSLATLANSKAKEIGQVVDREIDQIRTVSLNKFVQDTAEAVGLSTPLSAERIEVLDQQWRTADETDPLVSGLLKNDLSGELREFQRSFPEHAEVFLTDKTGLLLAATRHTAHYYQADEEWWQVAAQRGVYVGQPEFDESRQTVGLIIAVAVPAHDRDDIVGVLRTTVNESVLIEPLNTGRFGNTGHVHINLPSGQELHLKTGPEVSLRLAPARLNIDRLLQSSLPYAEVTLTSGALHYAGQSEVAARADPPAADAQAIADLGWRVVAHQERSEALQTVENSARVALLATLAVLIIAGALAWLVAQLLTRPITRLTGVAAQVSGGDLSVQVPVETNDEIGALATTFNVMTTQLRESLEGLEQRVSERTRALRTTIEVSRRISTSMDRGTLAAQVVEQLQSAFGYYHAHIYFFDEAKQNLVMMGGTGDAGRRLLERGHRLPKGRGLVGRAAERNEVVLVPDTLRDAHWLPNPLLPETKAEVAVPIAVGEQVFGVLDVQQNVVNGLSQEDADLLQSLANQVAIALQNAQSFERAREQAALEAQLNAIGQKIQSATSVEGALQIAARELGRALGGARTRVRLKTDEGNGNAHAPSERGD